MVEILFEDDFLILVNKPAMVLSQPSFNQKRLPIKEMLEQQRPDLKGQLYLHHRLDYETSGVFLMSKNKQANAGLSKMFQTHEFEKNYLCLTRPNKLVAGKKVECIINEAATSEAWIIKNYMAPAKDMVNHKKRMISVKSGGWSAETSFTILYSKPDFHYIKASPKTGRTHQIRQHLQESYRSILGDNIYGGKSDKVPRLMLHAHQLIFQHPIHQNKMTIEAVVPKDFESLLK